MFNWRPAVGSGPQGLQHALPYRSSSSMASTLSEDPLSRCLPTFLTLIDGSSSTCGPPSSSKVAIERLRDPIDQMPTIFVQLPATLVYEETDYTK